MWGEAFVEVSSHSSDAGKSSFGTFGSRCEATEKCILWVLLSMVLRSINELAYACVNKYEAWLYLVWYSCFRNKQGEISQL